MAIGPPVVAGADGNANTGTLSLLHSRRTLCLDGGWRVIIDPYDMGYVGILGGRNERGFFRDFKPRGPSDRVEYDFDASPTLAVPGDWNTQDDRLLYYEGTVWYRRIIDVAPDTFIHPRQLLHVGAANHTARVFLDGDELAVHAGGFAPWTVELTGRLGPGRHSLVIAVNNRREPDRVPAMRSDWWNFGGLHRSVHVVDVPATFIRHAWITMGPDGVVTGGVEVDGPDPGPTEIAIDGLGVRTEVDGRFTLDGFDPPRWGPGQPVLHDVTWECGQDGVRDQVGFRTVRVEGSDILVNDRPTFLRGISIHGEAPTGGRRAHGPDDAATLLRWATELGANFVRLAHYGHDEAMVRECDRVGLLAWAELPVYWGIDFANPAVAANAAAQLNELVVRDRSRASVIIWSVANETEPTPDRTRVLGDLAATARRLDPTRLISAALLTMPTQADHHQVDDPLGQDVDVIGVNQYLGWYYGDRDTIPTTTWSNPWDKPIVFTELGAGAKAGHRGESDQIWTEDFQAAVYEAQIEMVRRGRSGASPDGRIAGLSPWILKDFRAPVRVLPGIQDGYNRKGLVSEEGQRKLAFTVLSDFYRTT